MAEKTLKKKFSFGTSTIAKMSPAKDKIGPETVILNLSLTFEEALKLNIAIDECVRSLNGYMRSTTAGKRKGLNLAIHIAQDRITVNETNV